MSSIGEDIDDLVGGGLRRPSATHLGNGFAAGKSAMGGDVEMELGTVRNGVTSTWLAQALGMSVKIARGRLANCPATKRNGKIVYTLREALPYLVKPKLDADTIKKLRPGDLPDQLRDSYWSAKLKQQQWEENAKHLWRDEDVLEVFGATFQAIKFAVQLWVDDLEREIAVTPAQVKFLVQKADELQQKVYDELIKVPAQRATKSSVEDKPSSEKNEWDEDVASLI